MPDTPLALPLLKLGHLELDPALRDFQPGPAVSDLVVTATVEVPDSGWTVGVKFLPDFPEADRKAFLEAAGKTWDELAKAAGPKAVSYRAEVLKSLGR